MGSVTAAKVGDGGTVRLANTGCIVSVRGSVADMRFDARLPPIHTMMRTGAGQQILIKVLAQLDAHQVRGIALTPTQGLAHGMVVEDSGGPLLAPVQCNALSHCVGARQRKLAVLNELRLPGGRQNRCLQ